MRQTEENKSHWTFKVTFPSVVARTLMRACGLVTLGFITTVAKGQPVTIDFTRTRDNPSTNIPWSEDGFSVTSPTPMEFAKPGGVSVTTGSSTPGTTPFPPSGLLQFRADGSQYTFVTALLANESNQTFDLLSVDLYSFTTHLSPTTNYARVYSSAGESFDLLSAPDQTTLTFGGDAWRNLSFVSVELFSEGAPSHLLLDNFVVQVNTIPEPSCASLVILMGSIWLWSAVRRNNPLTRTETTFVESP